MRAFLCEEVELVMATDESIKMEIAKLGRLSPEQEGILYAISLRQDELGREQTNMLLSKFEGNPLYAPMVKREYLTYQTYNHGGDGSHEVASLFVTLKGLRYCIMFADEISARRKTNPAGAVRAR